MENIYLTIVLAPLLAAIVAGLFGRQIGRAGAHWLTIMAVALSCGLSIYVLKGIVVDGDPVFNGSVYTWADIDGLH
ncbi:MAG: NADH-quinone oxidoreductase subunit L, partial [Proteobacteria bacterium]|nr:NADH-quinone oxidoreductase subunit L [Pseudomonadota bacterium]